MSNYVGAKLGILELVFQAASTDQLEAFTIIFMNHSPLYHQCEYQVKSMLVMNTLDSIGSTTQNLNS